MEEERQWMDLKRKFSTLEFYLLLNRRMQGVTSDRFEPRSKKHNEITDRSFRCIQFLESSEIFRKKVTQEDAVPLIHRV